MRILVTGGTGRLGRPTVAALRKPGHEVRVLSRTPDLGPQADPDRVVGDLSTGAGIADAVSGVDTVLHLATTRSKDLEQTRRLLAALDGSGVHLIYVSIVGVDRIPFGYYRDKVANERLIEASGVPHTIIRVTQFHGFVCEFLDAQRRLPVTLVLPVSAQSIHMPDVAERLVELVSDGPSGRVPDLGGPEQLPLGEYARQWQAARGLRRPIWILHLPGATMRAFRGGEHMPGLPGAGRVTFAEYLAAEAPPARAGAG
jgi:uncharacterized protein YbjT (DUF2867 family)